jgi:anti-anti-sigma factor
MPQHAPDARARQRDAERSWRAGWGASIARGRRPGAALVEVRGELDLAAAPALTRKLRQAGDEHELVSLDLSAVTFIDCSALRVLIWARRRAQRRGRTLEICAGSRQVRWLLELTGTTELLRDAGASPPQPGLVCATSGPASAVADALRDQSLRARRALEQAAGRSEIVRGEDTGAPVARRARVDGQSGDRAV